MVGTCVLALVGCVTSKPQPTPKAFDAVLPTPKTYTGLTGADAMIPTDRVDSITEQLATQGINELARGNLVDANQHFNQALMFDPADSTLQWLNGVTYHLRVVQGEASQFPMAKEAYSLSLQFDPSNWRAYYQLGLLYLDGRDYAAAQNSFAEAILFRPRDPDLIYQMLCASYYNHDPEAAAAALLRLQSMEPDSPRTLRAAPLVMAAVGEHEEAMRQLNLYQQANPGLTNDAMLQDRVDDWREFYRYHQKASLQLASADAEHEPGIDSAAQMEDTGFDEEPQRVFAADLESDMVIVDVAIIESEEDLGTRKGVNLLNGLRIQYGLDRDSTDRRVETSQLLGDGEDSIVDTFTRTLTKAISIPQLDYSLNIFNSAIFTNEVLARPTLIALNGQTSHFFAGKNVQAAATASSTVGTVTGGQAIKINEDIGVNLSVTPTLRPDGLVRIDAEVTRTFLEQPDSAIDFQFKIQTAKTHVAASVVIAFGETLILSGLAERESETFRDGIPILQDIPIIQYFFSEERTLDFQKSVLVMLTPRRPFTLSSWADERTGDGGSQSEDEEPMRALRNRFETWFKPAPHWVDIIDHLEEGGLFREFRSGDLEIEMWTETEAFRKRFGDVIEFLYF